MVFFTSKTRKTVDSNIYINIYNIANITNYIENKSGTVGCSVPDFTFIFSRIHDLLENYWIITPSKLTVALTAFPV